MPATFNSSDNGRVYTTTSISSSRTVPSLTSGAAIFFWRSNTSGLTGMTCSLGGVSGAEITGTAKTGTGSQSGAFIIVAPPSGSQTLSVSWTTESGDFKWWLVYLEGVNQTTPTSGGANSTESYTTTKSLQITSESGDLTVTFCGSAQDPTSNQTEIGTHNAGTQPDYGPGTGTTTHGWTIASNAWIYVIGLNAEASASNTIIQEGYRWRLDDGDEANATWAAAQDTGITAPANAVRRLRVLVDTTGDANATQFQLEYKEANDANFTKVS